MAQLLSNFGADLTGLRQGASCAAREKTPSFLQPIRVCRHALVPSPTRALAPLPDEWGRAGHRARNSAVRIRNTSVKDSAEPLWASPLGVEGIDQNITPQ